MFTGIIEEVGRITEKRISGKNVVLSVGAEKIFEELKIGDSISVNGVCLTAEGIKDKIFQAALSPETTAKTNLGAAAAGTPVNLERALKYGDRVGGHFLSGHIDFKTKLLDINLNNESGTVKILIPQEYRKYIFPKCSIGIDGISLTVAEIKESNIIIWVIPHTIKNTNLFTQKGGCSVNIEIDMFTKAVFNTRIECEPRKISKEAYI